MRLTKHFALAAMAGLVALAFAVPASAKPTPPLNPAKSVETLPVVASEDTVISGQPLGMKSSEGNGSLTSNETGLIQAALWPSEAQLSPAFLTYTGGETGGLPSVIVAEANGDAGLPPIDPAWLQSRLKLARNMDDDYYTKKACTWPNPDLVAEGYPWGDVGGPKTDKHSVDTRA